MKLITKRQLIKSLPERWKANYFDDVKKEWRQYKLMGDVEKIYNSLTKLDLDNCTDETVEKLTGMYGWTALVCDECKKNVNAVIEVGEEAFIESRTVDICFDCLKNAKNMAEISGVYS